MRNKLAHDYRAVDEEIVFDIIKNELPELKEALIDMINSIEIQKPVLRELLDTAFYGHIQYLLDS
jgi:uncharacterized protein YutE (UPF0331/DUF86 family)